MTANLRRFPLHAPVHRSPRWLWWLSLCLVLTTIVGCDALLLKKKRKFGSTCGNATECESGVCSHGVCTQSCGSDGDCGGDLCIESTCQSQDSDYDGDGLMNGQEKVVGTSPTKADSDGDGIDDGTEVGGDFTHPKDTNADGIPDALQSNISDADGDCIVDAFDLHAGSADPLPKADGICNKGVCAANPSQAKLSCYVKMQGASVVGLSVGCTGCVCEAPDVADWEAAETHCDGLDNDCDGTTDAGLMWTSDLPGAQPLPLGAPCYADKGMCAFPPAGSSTPKAGTVECGTDKKATCSTLGNGTASLAIAEKCNGLDDDCDGQTDEDFLWQNHHVGDSCADTCGGTPLFCDDKTTPIGGAVVRCLDESTAMCAGEPWDSHFQEKTAGVPGPRWYGLGAHMFTGVDAASLTPTGKLLVTGGEVPGDSGSVLRDDAWYLDLAALAAGQSQSVAWTHEPHGGLPVRIGAAWVQDVPNKRNLLIGGFTDTWQSSISVVTPDPVTVGEDPTIPPLPGPIPLTIAQERVTHAVILQNGTSGHRSLLVVSPHLLGPMTLPLENTITSAWQPAPAYTGDVLNPVAAVGDVLCLAATPDGSRALLVAEDGATWWAEDDGTQAVLHQMTGHGDTSAVPRQDAVCVVDGANVLHVIGGQLGGTGTAPYVTADVPALAADPTPTIPADVTWTVQTVQPQNAAPFTRVGGFGFWHAPSATIVLGGGWVPQTVASGAHRHGVWDVWAMAPDTQTATRLDATNVPQGRIGAAQGWRQKTGEWCIAGGLTYDLPDVPGGPSRAVPVTDAWCVTKDGIWSQVGDNILYAFGIGGVDAVNDRFVLAGGFALTPGEAIPDLVKLWTGALPVQKLGNTLVDLPTVWQPSAAIHTLDLATKAWKTEATDNPHALTASSVAHDPIRNRLIISGGFDKIRETHAFLTLDLTTLTWKDVGALVPQSGFCGGECHPYDRYGAPILYNPVLDVVVVTAGSLRTADGSLGQDTGVNGDLGCNGWAGNTLWMGQTLTPSFLPLYVPNFADDAHTKPLLQQYFGGPVFIPVLFDWLGGRAWMAAQLRGIPDFGGPSLTPCTNPPPAPQQWTGAGVQVSLAVGLCKGLDPKSVTAKLEQQQIATPAALIHAAAYLHVPTGQAYLFSGLEPDGSVGPGLWTLAQTCEKP